MRKGNRQLSWRGGVSGEAPSTTVPIGGGAWNACSWPQIPANRIQRGSPAVTRWIPVGVTPASPARPVDHAGRVGVVAGQRQARLLEQGDRLRRDALLCDRVLAGGEQVGV